MVDDGVERKLWHWEDSNGREDEDDKEYEDKEGENVTYEDEKENKLRI